MKKNGTTNLENLRMKAEELLKKKLPKNISQLSEADILKLIHEVEVHQIELELQQEEIIWAEQHALEEAAKIVADEYIEMYDLTQSGYFSLSHEGVILALNHSGANMLGKERSQLIKSSFGFFVSEATRPIFNLFLDNVFTSRVKESCEITLLKENHLSMYVDLVGILSATGEHCLVAVSDITGVRHTEDTLALNNSRIDFAMRAVNMAWWEMDIATGNVTFGKRKAEMLGYPSEMFKHYTDFTALLHPEDYEKAMDAMRKHYSGNADKYEVEYRLRTNAGEYKWFYDIGSIVKRDLNGTPLNITGIVIDISDRKRSEAQTMKLLSEVVESRRALLSVIEDQKQTSVALRNSETSLRTLIHTIPDLIWVKNADGVYLSCNTMFERFFGAKEVDIVGKTDYDFVDRELADFFRDHDRKAMAAEKPTINEEWITFADDGHRAFLETIKAPMYDSTGKLTGVLGIGRDITERKLAENALNDSFERYKKLALISPIGIFHTDENGLTTFVNPTWSKISGLSYEDALGNNWLSAVHPDDKEELLEGWKDANQLHKTSYSDYRFVHPDGSIAWVMGQAVPETNAEGKLIGYIGTITDITERKKAEDAIRESNFFLQILLNAIPVPIFYKDIEGRYIGLNKAFEQFFGKSSQELEGKSVFDISPREHAEIYHAKDMELIRKKGVQVYDSQIKDSQDVVHDVVFHKAAIVDSNEQVVGLIGVILDISERKSAEKEIAMLAHSLKCVNECVSITDLNDKILFVNESFLKTYGYELDELIGKNINIVRSKKNAPELVNDILPTTIRGEWHGELLNKRKDGSEFPIFLSTTIIKDKENKILGLIGVGTDISERKLAEQELINAKEHAEESDRLKSSFLANMSHEIRTPMNGIMGFAGLLKEPDLTSEETEEYIEMIEKSGIRMLNIINDIVCISKVESGLMEISISKTNINEQIEYIYTFFKPEANQKGIQLSFKNSLPAKEAIVNTDREKIYAILTNLVKNAIKFTAKGAIEFGYSKKGEFFEFFVADSGLGILNEQKEYIFERFRQGSESLSRNYEGAGLGLSISKAFVEMLGGKIWLDSEYGKGTTFYFTIPFQSETEEKNDSLSSDPNAENKVLPEASKLKILVVDDDEASGILLEKFVGKLSSEIITVHNGRSAVETCRNNPDIDFILMDIKMPEMDGYEATRQIRQFNNNVVIIAQTAYALIGDMEKALEAGCNDYIAKPFGQTSLAALMKKYLNGLDK